MIRFNIIMTEVKKMIPIKSREYHIMIIKVCEYDNALKILISRGVNESAAGTEKDYLAIKNAPRIRPGSSHELLREMAVSPNFMPQPLTFASLNTRP